MSKKSRISRLVIGVMGCVYFGWALYRFSDSVLVSMTWPRDWPFPDPWLAALHE